MKNEIDSQEKIYQNLNTVISNAIRTIKWVQWPITVIFVVVLIVWGVDIYRLRSALKNIQRSLNLDVKEIELSMERASLNLIETQKLLKSRIETFDTTFNVLNDKYILALSQSNSNLNSLRENSNNLNQYSKLIRENTQSVITEYEKAQEKYLEVIKYATEGADQRKKDLDNIFKRNQKILIQLTNLLIDFKNYIDESTSGAIIVEEKDVEKQIKMGQDLIKELQDFQGDLKELN